MITWFIVAGAVALLMTYVSGRVRRMPLSAAIIYLGIGYLLGPNVFGLLAVDPRTQSHIIEAVTEIVIVVSIFSSALKLRVPTLDWRWLGPLRLALVSMDIGVGGVTTVGHVVLGLPIGTALLLGAILAPTDPVLASDVQVERPFEFNRLRFALTGEAGMNDGAAFPLVSLSLALLSTDPISSFWWTWLFQNVIWGLLGAVAIGALLGHLGARYMLYLRLVHREKLGTDNLLALGLMSLSFGLAEAAHAIGFVAVFAAGVAARGIERQMEEHPPETIEVQVADPADEQEAATDPDKASVFMLLRLQSFTENLEQVGAAAVVILLGSLLRTSMFVGDALVSSLLLFFIIRPISVFASLVGSEMNWAERCLAAWFGIRGMASVYYLAYVYGEGAPEALVDQLAEVVLGVVTYSILLHGITVTPVMQRFEDR